MVLVMIIAQDFITYNCHKQQLLSRFTESTWWSCLALLMLFESIAYKSFYPVSQQIPII